MNKRILELAKKAGIDVTALSGTYIGGFPREDMIVLNDFAELIIEECANVCLSQRNPPNLNYKPSEQFAEEIKRHFGVNNGQ